MALTFKKAKFKFFGIMPLVLLFFISLNGSSIINIKFFSVNIHYILVYYWVLRQPQSLGYGFIFLSGIISDVVLGFPIGINALSLLFVAGVATVIQTVGYGKIGSRLPIIQGTSFAFIPVMAPFAKAGLGAVFTAAFIGGIFQMWIGRILKPIRHLFPPLVTGIVVLMIGVSLLKVGFMYAGGGGWLLNNKPEVFGNSNHLIISFTVLIVSGFPSII